MAVAMTVAFPAMDHGKEEMEKEVRQQVGEILNGLSARTMESTLEVKLIQAGTVLSFTWSATTRSTLSLTSKTWYTFCPNSLKNCCLYLQIL